MKEDEIMVQVQKINSEFYNAFENLGINPTRTQEQFSF